MKQILRKNVRKKSESSLIKNVYSVPYTSSVANVLL